MKTTNIILSAILAGLLLAGCSVGPLRVDVNLVHPSDVIVTQERPVSGFTAIEFSTFGKVVLLQGESESLTIQGSDNIVPMVDVQVTGGTLVISMQEDVDITAMNKENILLFTIHVRDLEKLSISGAASVNMDRLETPEFSIAIDGAAQFALGQLTTGQLDATMSGVGSMEIAGEADSARITISGAGPVTMPDLQIKNADVTISGLGSAKLCVTDTLTGSIDGAGNVAYYGNPQANTRSSGLGVFESLGSK